MPQPQPAIPADPVSSQVDILDRQGFILLDSIIGPSLLEDLRTDLASANKKCFEFQQQHHVGNRKNSDDNPLGADGALGGAAHHVLPLGSSFVEFLEQQYCFDIISNFLGGKFILNAFGGVTNTRDNNMYEHCLIVHRDARSFHPSFRQMLWMLVMLDDFTEDNGATLLLAGSHTQEHKPQDEIFFSNAAKAIGKAGSIALFDGRLWHACGRNNTDRPRRALTLAFTLPFIKPQMDYVRAFGPEKVSQMSDNMKQLLGYHARVPANHDEWYQPPENRFYQSNQG